MANREKIFEFDASQSIDNIKNLRAQIKDLKSDLDQLTIGSEDYDKVAADLREKQARLNDVIKDSKTPYEDAADSINSMNKRLRELTAEWRAADEEGRKALTPQIVDLKNKVNAANESVLNFQHNVGNYSGGIIDAFQKMGISVTSLTGPLKKVGVDIESMDTSLKLLLGSFKTFSGQNLAALKQALTGVTAGTKSFIAGLNGIQKALLATGLGAFIALLGVLIAHWKEWVGVTDDETDALYRANSIAKDLNDTLSDEDRMLAYHIELKKLQGAKEQEILEYELGELKRLRDLALEKANEIQANMELITSEEGLAEARKAHSAAMDEYNKYSAKIQQNYLNQVLAGYRARKEASKKAAEAAKEEAQAFQRLYEEADKEIEKQLDKLIQKETERMQTAFDVQAELEKARMTEEERENVDYAIKKRLLQEYNLDTENLEKEHRKNLAEIRDAARQAQLESEYTILEQLAELNKSREEAENPSVEGGTGISAAMKEAEEAMASLELYRTYVEEKIKLNDQLKVNYEEGSAEYTALETENATLRMSLAQKEHEAKVKNDKVEKKLIEARREAYKNMTNSTVSLLKNLSSAMGESTKMGKGFAIAAATIDTIASAVAGFRAGMNQWADAGPMAWMGPVQAALNAAMALTAGYAEVQKIASVDTSGNATSGGGSATALAMPNIEGLSSPVDYTRQVTTETEQEEMNRNNRVYILESDIQESGNRVKVREEETTF